jgi:hypothetical protein
MWREFVCFGISTNQTPSLAEVASPRSMPIPYRNREQWTFSNVYALGEDPFHSRPEKLGSCHGFKDASMPPRCWKLFCILLSFISKRVF